MSSCYRFGVVPAAVLAAIILFQSPMAQAQPKIGVAAAVSNEVAVGTRRLVAGSDVHTNERVRTGDASNAQLLFLDETSLNIGPKSEVILDRFVYDPSRGTGSVVMTAARGAFRFVSGSQNPVNYTIKTPVATIGVRGTILDIYVTANALLVIVQQGSGVIGGVVVQAGYAALVVNGQVQVFRYDASIINAGVLNFPLFGNTFFGDPRRLEFPDSRKDLIDQLFGIDLRNQNPPPPPIDSLNLR